MNRADHEFEGGAMTRIVRRIIYIYAFLDMWYGSRIIYISITVRKYYDGMDIVRCSTTHLKLWFGMNYVNE